MKNVTSRNTNMLLNHHLLFWIKLSAITFFCIITITSCSNKDENLNSSNSERNPSNGVLNSIFWATPWSNPAFVNGIGDIPPRYLYFYSKDSCFVRKGGNLSGTVLPYVFNGSDVIIIYKDSTKEKYKLLGEQILLSKPDNRPYYRVENFVDAFLGNK